MTWNKTETFLEMSEEDPIDPLLDPFIREFEVLGYVYSVSKVRENTFAASSAMGLVSIFDVNNPTEPVASLERNLTAVTSLEYLGGNRIIFGEGRPQCRIRSWNFEEKRVDHEFGRSHNAAVNQIKLLSDGYFASTSGDGTLGLWDSNKGVNIYVHAINRTASVYDLDKVNNHVVITCCNDISVSIWNIHNRECLHDILPDHNQGLRSVTFRDPYFATASYDGSSCVYDIRRLDRHLLKLTDPQNGQLFSVRFLEYPKQEGYLSLVTGTSDGSLRFWNIENGNLVSSIQGHGGWVRCFDILEDGETLISGSHDTLVKSWDIQKIVLPRPSQRRSGHQSVTQEVKSEEKEMEKSEGMKKKKKKKKEEEEEEEGERMEIEVDERMSSYHQRITYYRDINDRLEWLSSRLCDLEITLNEYSSLRCSKRILSVSSVYSKFQQFNPGLKILSCLHISEGIDEFIDQSQFLKLIFYFDVSHTLKNIQIQNMIKVYELFDRLGTIRILQKICYFIENYHKNDLVLWIDLFVDYKNFNQIRNTQVTQQQQEEETEGEDDDNGIHNISVHPNQEDNEANKILRDQRSKLFRILHKKISSNYEAYQKIEIHKTTLVSLNFDVHKFEPKTKTKTQEKKEEKSKKKKKEEEEDEEEEEEKQEEKKIIKKNITQYFVLKSEEITSKLRFINQKERKEEEEEEEEQTKTNLILKTMDGEIFKVHREIVVFRSNFFYLLLKHPWKESNEEFVVINQLESYELTLLLEFLYTKKLRKIDDLNTLFVLLNHGEMYFEFDLVEYVRSRIMDVSTETLTLLEDNDSNNPFFEQLPKFAHYFHLNDKFKNMFYEYWNSFNGITREKLDKFARKSKKEHRIHYQMSHQKKRIDDLEIRVEEQNKIIMELRKMILEMKNEK